MPSLFAFCFVVVAASGLRVNVAHVPAEFNGLQHNGNSVYNTDFMEGIGKEDLDPVYRIVNEMRKRITESGLAVNQVSKGFFRKTVDSGVEAWKGYQKERDDVEDRFNKSEKKGSVKMFFEHVTHAGGTQFCRFLSMNEKVIQPNSNCLAHPNEDPHWTKSTWQLGKTGIEADAFVKSLVTRAPFNAIANEDLMPATPSFGKDMVYLTVIRNPYTRHMTDVFRIKDNFTHQNNFNKIPLDNYETRHFCGEPCRDIPFGGLKQEHLDLALENLAHFSFVGPTEHAPCFQELENKFSWNVDDWKTTLQDLSVETQQAAAALKQFLDEGNIEAYQDFLAMHVYDEQLYKVAKGICISQKQSRAQRTAYHLS